MSMRILLGLFLLISLLPAEEAAPPPLTEYKGRTIAQTMHWSGAEWLMRQNREQEENAALMLPNMRHFVQEMSLQI